MKRINLKIRPLDRWMIESFNKNSFGYDKNQTDLNENYKKINPIYFKNNWYLQVINNKKYSWFEIETKDGWFAYEYSVESFEYSLNEDDYLKVPEKVITSLRNLHKLDPKILTDKQYSLLWSYDWKMQQIRSLRESKKGWDKIFKDFT